MNMKQSKLITSGYNKMGGETSVSECAKMCQGMLDGPQRQKYANEMTTISQKQNLRPTKPKKYFSLNDRTEVYKSRLIVENQYESRSSPAFQLISQYINKDQRYQLPLVKFQSGSVYAGQWSQDQMDGQGKLSCADGSMVQGKFLKGKVSGMAKIQFADGDTYEGQWENNKAHGFGVYKHSSGAIYEGYWQRNMQSGIGIEIWMDNSKYEGSYLNGKKHGDGMYTWADGSYYKGSWQNNKIQGYGQYIWNNGRSYKGQWKNNQMHGHGIHVWEDGRKYDGNYVYDKKQGQGKYYWPDGKRFQGRWTNGKRQGLGKIISDSGECKIGLWQNDKKVKWLTQQEVQDYMNPTTNRSRKQTKNSNELERSNSKSRRNISQLDMSKIHEDHDKISQPSPPKKSMGNFQSIKNNQRLPGQRPSLKKGRKIFRN